MVLQVEEIAKSKFNSKFNGKCNRRTGILVVILFVLLLIVLAFQEAFQNIRIEGLQVESLQKIRFQKISSGQPVHGSHFWLCETCELSVEWSQQKIFLKSLSAQRLIFQDQRIPHLSMRELHQKLIQWAEKTDRAVIHSSPGLEIGEIRIQSLEITVSATSEPLIVQQLKLTGLGDQISISTGDGDLRLNTSAGLKNQVEVLMKIRPQVFNDLTTESTVGFVLDLQNPRNSLSSLKNISWEN